MNKRYKIVLKNNWIENLHKLGLNLEKTRGLMLVKNILKLNKYVKHIGIDPSGIFTISTSRVCHKQLLEMIPSNIISYISDISGDKEIDIESPNIKQIPLDTVIEMIAEKHEISYQRKYTLRLTREYSDIDKINLLKDKLMNLQEVVNTDVTYDTPRIIIYTSHSITLLFRRAGISQRAIKFIESTEEIIDNIEIINTITNKDIWRYEYDLNRRIEKNKKFIGTIWFMTKKITELDIPNIGNNRVLFKKYISNKFKEIDGVTRVYNFSNTIDKRLTFRVDFSEEIDFVTELSSRNIVDIFDSCKRM